MTTETTPTPPTHLSRLFDGAAALGALYAAQALFPFGLDKLRGTGSSVQGFRQIGGALGVDPTAFRFFVGVQEVAVALALGAALLAVTLPSTLPRLAKAMQRVAQLGAFGLVATMLGALATEWIVRPGQQDWLVRLALELLALGVVLSVWSWRRFGVPRLALRRLLSPSRRAAGATA